MSHKRAETSLGHRVLKKASRIDAFLTSLLGNKLFDFLCGNGK
jgi:hypothetical protein